MPNVAVLVRIVLTLFVGAIAQAPLEINEKAKKVLEDPNQIPPNIYQWIERNAHICTDVPVNGANSVNFLNAVEGARCSLCPDPRPSQPPKVACAVEIRPNAVDLDIGCHQIPELCIIELRERYAEFFAAGGKMPKAPRPSPDTLPIDSTEVFSEVDNPFDEKSTTEEPAEEVETTTVRADQFTLEAVPAVFVDLFDKNGAKVNGRRLKKRPTEEVSAPAPRKLTLIPPPSKRGNKRPIDDDKNISDREEKLSKTCRDKHDLCCFWASAGECNENPFWMRINCAKTCGTCNCRVSKANKCVSTGVECQKTTVSSTTRIKSTSRSTSKRPSTPSSTKTTTESTTSKASGRALSRRPPSSPRGGHPPGHRPQRPHFGLRRRVTTTTSTTVGRPRDDEKEDDPDYRSSDTMGGSGDYGGGGDDNIDGDFDNVGDDVDNDEDALTSDNGNEDDEKTSSSSTETTTRESSFPPSSPSTLSSAPSTSRSTCFNFNRLCRFWANLGECERNPFWMRPHCQKACGSCGETVEDILVPPQNDDCENQHTFCPFWSFIGECSANARWMSVNCKASCQLC